MTRRRALLRWLADWRNGATLLASVLVALVVVSYVEAVRSRADAIRAAQATAAGALDQRKAATRRIDELGAQLRELQAELVTAEGQRAQLYAELQAVIVQLRQLGADPVVVVDERPPSRSSTTRPTTRPSPSPSSTTRPTPPPPRPPPSPSPSCRPLPLVGCIPPERTP